MAGIKVEDYHAQDQYLISEVEAYTDTDRETYPRCGSIHPSTHPYPHPSR